MSRATITGSCSSRIACSRRFRLIPNGKTRSVGRMPCSTCSAGPSSSRAAAMARSASASSSAARSAAFTGPVPSSALNASRARLAWSRHSRWRSSSRTSRARTSAAATAVPARSSGPRSAISPATNGASVIANRLVGLAPGLALVAPPSGGPPLGGPLSAELPLPGPRSSRFAIRSPGITRPVSAPAGYRSPPADRAPRGSRQPPLAPGRKAGGRVGAPRSPSHVALRQEPGKSLAAQLLARRGARPRLGAMDAALVLPAQLRRDRVAAQHRVDRLPDVRVDHDPLAVLDLHDHVERRRRLSLQDALLGPAAARLLVPEGDALDPADQVGEGRVQHQVVQVVAVGRPDQLDAALGDRPRGQRLQLRADLVDHDDLGHVVPV